MFKPFPGTLKWAAAALAGVLWAAPPSPAQPPPLQPPPAPMSAPPLSGAEGPAAPALNRIFQVGTSWAMYGAPRDSRLNRDEFEALAGAVEETRFAADQAQIVVIVRGGDAGGAIGLLEKRGRKLSRLFIDPEGETPFAVWRRVGYKTSPEHILEAYRENVLAAEDLYRDLPIKFTGQVRRVTRDLKGEVAVEFQIRRTDLTLACRPWPDAPQLVDPKNMKAGLRLDVAGQFAGYDPAAGLRLHSCLFSPPE